MGCTAQPEQRRLFFLTELAANLREGTETLKELLPATMLDYMLPDAYVFAPLIK